MEAAIYARYSSENQRPESIEDQVAACRRLGEQPYTGARAIPVWGLHPPRRRRHGRSGIQRGTRDPHRLASIQQMKYVAE